MLTLVCIVVGEGRPFSVEIEPEKIVDVLKEKIKEKNKNTITCDAKDLELYLALKDDVWIGSKSSIVRELRKGIVRDTVKELIQEDMELDPADTIGACFVGGQEELKPEIKTRQIHVLVVVPEKPKTTKGEWSAAELSTVDPQVQSKLWKSVVRVIISISSCVEDTGTALVVDRTPTHLYLLTNLHLFLDEEYSDVLSDDFTKEIQRYLKLHPGKKPSGKRKNDAANISAPLIRRSKRLKKVPVFFQIAIEQLFRDQGALQKEKLKEVYKFSLESGICWRCSSDFDFAIFEVPTPPNVQLELVRCEMAYGVYPSMPVHVFGFPGSLKGKFDHDYAIIPAEVTGTQGSQMTLSTLSAPGLSGSAVVCTKMGIPVGYMGGGFDGSSKNEQYQSYGFTFFGMPRLPSAMPPQDDEETKD
ncbi:crinkler (CRN) family protein [Thraustotheca clavata]|uniref:Crinkler (CRN) family protein n=1 Tax=Thraustotheca clavata TaxID=74557 RepID=A0A1V9Y6X5_9STRA|nr:crinkler (CRN) family protein [Thraustotheca clavata]